MNGATIWYGLFRSPRRAPPRSRPHAPYGPPSPYG